MFKMLVFVFCFTVQRLQLVDSKQDRISWKDVVSAVVACAMVRKHLLRLFSELF